MDPKRAGLFVAAAVALIVALVFLAVGDGTGGGDEADGLAFVILGYFHALTWLLLALCFVLMAASVSWAKYAGYLAFGCYAVFLGTLALQ